MMQRRMQIAGLGSYLPELVISSAQLDAEHGFPPGYIERKTGVVERRRVQGETAVDMGAAAAGVALRRAGLEAKELDLIIGAQSVPAQAIPCNAVLLQRALGASGMACFDVNSTCLSFLTALDLAAYVIAAATYRAVLIVSSEVSSVGLDWRSWESSALFGDAAAAAVLLAAPEGSHSAVLTSHMETYSEGAGFTAIPGGGTLHHPNSPDTTPEMNLFHMDGPRVFRLASERMGVFLERLYAPLPPELRTCDLLIPHQASLFPIRQLSARFGYPESRVFVNLPCRGNCVAASIPLALCEAVEQGRVRRGALLTLVGTGAGLSLAGVVLRY